MKIPVFVTIKLSIDHVPTHRTLNDIKVVRYLRFRYRIFEIFAPVVTVLIAFSIYYTPHDKRSNIRHDLFKCHSERRFVREHGAHQ